MKRLAILLVLLVVAFFASSVASAHDGFGGQRFGGNRGGFGGRNIGGGILNGILGGGLGGFNGRNGGFNRGGFNNFNRGFNRGFNNFAAPHHHHGFNRPQVIVVPQYVPVQQQQFFAPQFAPSYGYDQSFGGYGGVGYGSSFTFGSSYQGGGCGSSLLY